MVGFGVIVMFFWLKINELMTKVFFTSIVEILSQMHNQIMEMRCQVRGHNTKNPNKFYYKSLKKMIGIS
jgi:hypothetical protein